LIQQILTTPRQPPGGVGGLTGANGGIAGVGGTADGTGIHIIRDHSKYKEWEFLYNLRYDSLGRVLTPQQMQSQNPLANGGSGR
jgi:hypothetical protein